MVLYSWSKVLLKAKTMTDILVIMHGLTWPSALRSKHHKNLRAFSNHNFDGHCFLINPEKLLNDPSLPKEEIVEYIALASKRNLASFLLGGDPRLDCRLVKTLPTNNRLITIENNHISFAYEQG